MNPRIAEIASLLDPFMSDAEVTAILLSNGVKLRYSIGVPVDDPRYRYTVDDHYELFVLASIVTIADAEAFLARLDAECNAVSSPKFRTGCMKATIARSWLEKPFWTATPDRIRCALAANRRVCCAAHERYSFAVRKHLFRPVSIPQEITDEITG